MVFHGPLTLRSILALAIVLLALTGCAGTGAVVIEGGDPYPPDAGYYDIPPGHMPPPGQCRIWYPDLPPGQQPPPDDCDYLRYHVPPGAWLIEG